MVLKIKILALIAAIAVVGLFVFNRQHSTLPVHPAIAKTGQNNAVKVEQVAPKPQSTACDSNTVAQKVIVSISQQHAWFCNLNTLAYDSAVTTGASDYGDGTPTGTWQIQGKATDVHLRGSDSRGSWDDFVNYWMPYNGAYGFHDSSWQTFSYGDLNQYKSDGSHGCVHLPLEAMKWLYNWAPVGTTVTINS